MAMCTRLWNGLSSNHNSSSPVSLANQSSKPVTANPTNPTTRYTAPNVPANKRAGDDIIDSFPSLITVGVGSQANPSQPPSAERIQSSW